MSKVLDDLIANPGVLRVRIRREKVYHCEGWEDGPNDTGLMQWIHNNVNVKRRPYIILDHEGNEHYVTEIVDARMGKTEWQEVRLNILYLHGKPPAAQEAEVATPQEKEEEMTGWGELLFIDNGPRMCYGLNVKLDWYTKRLLIREWWDRNVKRRFGRMP
jgi:hypothetical protein